MKSSTLIFVVVALALGSTLWGEETTNPKKIQGEMPVYSDFARSHDITGTVVVEALVDETGHVFAADVVQGVHADLDKAALAAVSDWTFEPAMEGGKPVMKVVRIPLNFQLIDPIRESLRSSDSAVAADK